MISYQILIIIGLAVSLSGALAIGEDGQFAVPMILGILLALFGGIASIIVLGEGADKSRLKWVTPDQIEQLNLDN